MRGDAHVRFGGRAEETGRSKDRNRASVRPYTEHPTREGKVYCAVVLDAYSRRAVGWSISHNPTAALASNALGMAIEHRDADHGNTVIHSDHGTQFTSWAFTDRARQSGLVPSMGSVGDCYDTQCDDRGLLVADASRAAQHAPLEDQG